MREKMIKFYVMLIYPLITLAFAGQYSLLYENLSYVGNQGNHRLFFILWGIATVLAMGISITRCIPYCYHKRQIKWMCAFTTGLLMFAILLPYLPKTYPFLSFLHLIFSFTAPTCLLLCVGLLLYEFYLMQVSFFKNSFQIFMLIIIIALGILFRYGSVNSLCEVFIAISTANLLYYMASKCCWMSKEENN